MARTKDEKAAAVEDPSLGDPETQVWDESKGEVVDMPSGEWTAALTDAGNPRHKGGLLILAP